MQQTEISKSLYDEIRENYEESIKILQELKEQQLGDKNEH